MTHEIDENRDERVLRLNEKKRRGRVKAGTILKGQKKEKGGVRCPAHGLPGGVPLAPLRSLSVAGRCFQRTLWGTERPATALRNLTKIQTIGLGDLVTFEISKFSIVDIIS